MRRLAGASLLLVLLVAFSALACNLAASQDTGAITVEIVAPPDGSSVPVSQPVTISSSAADPDGPGVSSVDLFVDGVVVHHDDVPGDPQASFACEHTWQPESEGSASIMVIAYRADGTASIPRTITLNVVGLTPAPTDSPSGSDFAAPGVSPTAPDAASAAIDSIAVQGQVTLAANIRSEPGATCPIVGVAAQGAVINLLEYSADNQWFRTDHVPGQVGWIWTGTVAVLGVESEIPHGDRLGCAGCGDGAWGWQDRRAGQAGLHGAQCRCRVGAVWNGKEIKVSLPLVGGENGTNAPPCPARRSSSTGA